MLNTKKNGERKKRLGGGDSVISWRSVASRSKSTANNRIFFFYTKDVEKKQANKQGSDQSTQAVIQSARQRRRNTTDIITGVI